MTKSIQQILDEQKQQSKIYEKSEHSINAIIAASLRTSEHYIGSMTDPVVRRAVEEKRLEGVKRASAAGTFSKAQKKRYEDPLARQKTSEASKKVAQRPGQYEKRQKASKDMWDNEELRKQASEAHIKQWDDQEKRKALSNRMQEIRCYPLITPDGPFLNTKVAGEHYGVGRATILYRLKKYPDQYWKISMEEYIMLTGKDK